jgi:hypothetical protein
VTVTTETLLALTAADHLADAREALFRVKAMALTAQRHAEPLDPADVLAVLGHDPKEAA